MEIFAIPFDRDVWMMYPLQEFNACEKEIEPRIQEFSVGELGSAVSKIRIFE